MHFLISICTVDGVMTQNELKTLRDISMRIELSQKSLDAIIAMFRFRNEQQQQQYNRTTKVSTSMLDDAYKIIGVSSTSGDSEIKKAYKKLAIAHHPDKFAHKGDLAQKNAAEKFKVIVGAYDLICKKRGIV
jgi:DnaJ like chaperone protein